MSMSRFLPVVALVFCAACGPDFAGVYAGVLLADRLCDTGADSNRDMDVRTSISSMGDEVIISSMLDVCGPIHGIRSSEYVELVPLDCGVVSSFGIDHRTQIMDGRLTHLGRSIDTRIELLITLTNTSTHQALSTCTEDLVGTLAPY